MTSVDENEIASDLVEDVDLRADAPPEGRLWPQPRFARRLRDGAPTSDRDVSLSALKPRSSTSSRRVVGLGLGWLAVTLVAAVLVCYGFGSLFEQRTQRALMSAYRTTLYDASVSVPGLSGTTASVLPPATGSPDGILEIGALHLQQVVTEGVGAGETEDGPGHVPGTAGLGQPGNAVVVARRSGFGGPFARLDALRPGNEIVVTTTQGQSVYKVFDVAPTTLYPGTTVPAATSTGAAGTGIAAPGAASAPLEAPSEVGTAVAVDDLYGPSTDNRLTLVTSGSGVPWNGSRATVVVAQLLGEPFAPTPQASRSDAVTGFTGSSGAWPALVLVLLGYGVVTLGAMFAYRRYGARAAWLLTTAPLVVLTVLVAEVGSQLLPAWM